ncbi:MAG: hypothetical protein SGPRY_009217 [Prymnesium sp.]
MVQYRYVHNILLIMLASLPAELLDVILGSLDASCLLALSHTSRALRTCADHDVLWQSLIRLRHDTVLRILFDDEVPPPRDGMSWKKYYFYFSAAWLRMAQARTGKLLLMINTACIKPGHSFSEQSFAIVDVTFFASAHPGADNLIIDLVETGEDATLPFLMAAHSWHALRILRELVVPGLECVSLDLYDPVDHKQTRAPRWTHLSSLTRLPKMGWQWLSSKVLSQASLRFALKG